MIKIMVKNAGLFDKIDSSKYIAPMQLKFDLRTAIDREELSKIKRVAFGGTSRKRQRKIARPLHNNLETHLVFSSNKAFGKFSFFTHKLLVARLLKHYAQKHLIEILDWVNMGFHLHIKVKFKDKAKFKNFLRAFTAVLARKITGACRGRPFGHFWNALPYTRILTSKFEIAQLRGYFEANHREREMGLSAREVYLKTWNEFLWKLRNMKRPVAME